MSIVLCILVVSCKKKKNKKVSIFPRSKCRYFSIMCSCTENGKMGENQIWELHYAPTSQYAHCTLQKVWFHSYWKSCLQSFLERTSTCLFFWKLLLLMLLPSKKSMFLAFLGSSIRAWVGHRVFRLLAVSHSGSWPSFCWLTMVLLTTRRTINRPRGITALPPLLSDQVLSCQILSFLVRLCPFLSDCVYFCRLVLLSTHIENHQHTQRYLHQGALQCMHFEILN